MVFHYSTRTAQISDLRKQLRDSEKKRQVSLDASPAPQINVISQERASAGTITPNEYARKYAELQVGDFIIYCSQPKLRILNLVNVVKIGVS